MTEHEREPIRTLATEFREERRSRWGWTRILLRLIVLAGFLVALGALYTVLQHAGVIGEDGTSAGLTQRFADVPEDHPQFAAIDEVVSAGIMEGDTEDLFSPRLPVTRAEFAEVVVKTMGWEVQADSSTEFGDVEGRAFLDSADYIAVVAERGVMNGVQTEPPMFGPREDLQRGHAIIVFIRAAREGLPQPDPEMDPAIEALPYVASVEEALNVAAANGLLDGTGIDPLETPMGEPIVRSEVAALAANVHDTMQGGDTTAAGLGMAPGRLGLHAAG